LYSCNAGNLTQYRYGTEKESGKGNVASVFSTKVKNGIVIAYDGNVGFGKTFLSNFGIGGYAPRLSNKQDSYYKILNRYHIKSRQPPIGIVRYYGGEYKVYGYFPDTEIVSR